MGRRPPGRVGKALALPAPRRDQDEAERGARASASCAATAGGGGRAARRSGAGERGHGAFWEAARLTPTTDGEDGGGRGGAARQRNGRSLKIKTEVLPGSKIHKTFFRGR